MTTGAGDGILKRSVAIAGHRTSISLEAPFWDVLRQIAERETISVQKLIGLIDADRGGQNLSSAIRVFVVNRLRAEVSRRGDPESPEVG
jgi:predicted DNA-binding ribbon-helix-helix protein